MRDFFASAQKEILITNAYVIPDENWLRQIGEQIQGGVRVRMLTNSLASHDVPAVNSHYKARRKRLLQAVLELYELRHDAALQSVLADTAPNQGGFVGLHVKAAVVDRHRVFIGSMNLDPRSENINSEIGVVIESTSLGAELAEVMERDMGPENAWRVRLNPAGDIRWEALDKVLIRQPARSFWQWIEDIVFMAFPRDLY